MPKQDYFAAASVLSTIKAPASVAANANSAALDILDYKGDCAFVMTSLNTAGSSPTLAVKLQASNDADLIGAITGTRTGTGTITEIVALGDAITEAVTLTFSSATEFAVAGGTTGAMAAGVVGTKYKNAQLEFLVTAGGTAFQNGDTIIIAVSARTWADVAGAAFTGLTTGAGIQKIATNVDAIGRFARFNFVIGGTSSPAYTVGIGIIGMQK